MNGGAHVFVYFVVNHTGFAVSLRVWVMDVLIFPESYSRGFTLDSVDPLVNIWPP